MVCNLEGLGGGREGKEGEGGGWRSKEGEGRKEKVYGPQDLFLSSLQVQTEVVYMVEVILGQDGL
jgi:hypothetical protein